MNKGWKLKLYKENGVVQRSDVALTQAIARTLVQRVLMGERLYPPEGQITLVIEEDSKEKTIVLQTYQIDAWCRRGNVIPGTGNELRGVLEKARKDYRTRKREELTTKMVDDAEAVLNRVLNIRSNVPVRDMFGNTVTNPDGSLVRRENPNLLRIKVDAAKYVTERLDPQIWGKKAKIEGRHLVFSLADLRRAKEEMESRGQDLG